MSVPGSAFLPILLERNAKGKPPLGISVRVESTRARLVQRTLVSLRFGRGGNYDNGVNAGPWYANGNWNPSNYDDNAGFRYLDPIMAPAVHAARGNWL